MMNSRQAANKCRNAQGKLAKEHAWRVPKLFPARATANHKKRLARHQADVDYWCAEANRLAAGEAAERAEMTAAIADLGPGGGGGGSDFDWNAAIDTGAGLIGDVAGAFTADGFVAPPSGLDAQIEAQAQAGAARRAGGGAATAAAGLVGIGLLAGGGYLAYRYFSN